MTKEEGLDDDFLPILSLPNNFFLVARRRPSLPRSLEAARQLHWLFPPLKIRRRRPLGRTVGDSSSEEKEKNERWQRMHSLMKEDFK